MADLHPFLLWLRELELIVGDPYRFAVRRGSELDRDRAVLLRGWSAQSNVSQILIRTATHQLLAARDLHAVGAPPSAVPALVRAALETASTAAWLLQPSDALARIERFLRYMRQDAYDRAKWEGRRPEDDRSSRELLELGSSVGVSRTRLKQRFNSTETIRDIDVAADVEAERLWMLTSGLIHGRQWAVDEAAREDSFDLSLDGGSTVTQLNVPRVAFGQYQLRTGKVLDAAIEAWNARSGQRPYTLLPRASYSVDGQPLHPRYKPSAFGIWPASRRS